MPYEGVVWFVLVTRYSLFERLPDNDVENQTLLID